MLVGHGHWNSHSIGNGYPYIASEVVSIFELIQDPSVRVELNQFKELKSLPNKHLHISVIACCAENFALSLASGLHKLTTKDKRWVISIMAGKRDMLMFMPTPEYNKKYYMHKCTFLAYRLNKFIRNIMALAWVALVIASLFEGALFKNDDTSIKLTFGSIAPGVLLILCLIADKLIIKNISRDTNIKDKVVIHTNFKKDSKSYYTMLSKNRFKKLNSEKGIDSEPRLNFSTGN